jgi:DNA polymerase-3 subunit epsilon
VLNDFTVVDLETTGLDPVAGRITEIAARRYRNGRLCGAMSVLVWAGIAPSAEALAKTNNGLSLDVLEHHGLDEERCLSKLFLLLDDSVLVAHNAAFEMSWLHQARLRVFGDDFYNEFLCTKTLAAALLALPSYSLKALTTLFGIPLENAHRAMPDVVATRELLNRLTSMPACDAALLESLRNCCGANRDGRGAHYPLPAGLPAHVKEVKQ